MVVVVVEIVVVLVNVAAEWDDRAPTLHRHNGIHPRSPTYRLVGLVVRRPSREWKIPGSNPA